MPDYQVQIALRSASGITADYSTNSWSCTGNDASDAALFKDQLIIFYNAVRPNFSVLMNQNGHTWKIYQRSDPVPRAPVLEGTFNLSTAPSGGALPPEVAVCLSFQSPRASGFPQARRRGRIYLGPVGVSIVDSNGRPAAAQLTQIASAAQALKVASLAAPTWEWTVWSKMNNAGSQVTNGWVDNEFDTQRRRGRDPTSRTTWS